MTIQRAKKVKGLKGKNVYTSHKDLTIFHAIMQHVLEMGDEFSYEGKGFTREELEYTMSKLPQPAELAIVAEEPAAPTTAEETPAPAAEKPAAEKTTAKKAREPEMAD